MQKCFAFIVLSLAAFSASATSINVHGVSIPASDIEYYNGTNTVANFAFADDVVLPFARGDSFVVSTAIYLHRSGDASLVFSYGNERVEWKRPSGEILSLGCGKHP